MIKIQQIQARAIAQLAPKIEKYLIDPKSALIALVTDGVPVARGIRYALWQQNQPCKLEYLCASTKDKWWVDSKKLDILKATYTNNRVYVDWRTNTGTLCQLLRLMDQGSKYAVLSNPSSQQCFCAATDEIPKFDYPTDYEETMKTIGLWIEPHELEEDIVVQNKEYWEIETDLSMEFYADLFQKIKEFLPKND